MSSEADTYLAYLITEARYPMNLRGSFIACCVGLLVSVAGHGEAWAGPDTLLLEFVQDMAWLEDNGIAEPVPDQPPRIESINSFFDAARERLDRLSSVQSTSVAQVTDAFAAHQRLVNQLAESERSIAPDAVNGPGLAQLEANPPKTRVRLENLTLNYLHLAQLVLFDELGNSDRRLTMSAHDKQRMLTVIARYPVDQENADGYLSALWFIRENLKKWKCADEI